MEKKWYDRQIIIILNLICSQKMKLQRNRDSRLHLRLTMTSSWISFIFAFFVFGQTVYALPSLDNNSFSACRFIQQQQETANADRFMAQNKNSLPKSGEGDKNDFAFWFFD